MTIALKSPLLDADEDLTTKFFGVELIEQDSEILESNWHRANINLLVDCTHQDRTGATDYYTGGNMFIYYSAQQARNRDYRGPDFFVVLDIDDGKRYRGSWVVWDENGRYPNVIVELMSPTTAEDDVSVKKDLYEQTFRTPDYFCYDPYTHTLQGWRHNGHHYIPLQPNENGWLWSEELGLWLGLWEGTYLELESVWLRFYDRDGNLVPTSEEAQQQRAESAEAQLMDLQERLRTAGIDPDNLPKP